LRNGASSLVAQCITNNNMQILEADTRFSEVVRRELSELRGMSILDFTHAEDRAPNTLHLDSLRERGEAFLIVKRYVRPDGTLCWVRNHVSRMRDGVAGTVLIATIEALEPPLEGEHALVEVANRILKRRDIRCGRFGEDIFSEPASDILVDLFVNAHHAREVHVSSACLASHVPHTTALRHIALLEDRGLIARVADPFDKRRFLVELTGPGREKVTAMLDAIRRAEAG